MRPWLYHPLGSTVIPDGIVPESVSVFYPSTSASELAKVTFLPKPLTLGPGTTLSLQHPIFWQTPSVNLRTYMHSPGPWEVAEKKEMRKEGMRSREMETNKD